MLGGGITLKLDSVKVYKDQITFRDKDGGRFHICAYELEEDFVSKLLDAISEYQERNMDDDIGYMF